MVPQRCQVTIQHGEPAVTRRPPGPLGQVLDELHLAVAESRLSHRTAHMVARRHSTAARPARSGRPASSSGSWSRTRSPRGPALPGTAHHLARRPPDPARRHRRHARRRRRVAVGARPDHRARPVPPVGRRARPDGRHRRQDGLGRPARDGAAIGGNPSRTAQPLASTSRPPWPCTGRGLRWDREAGDARTQRDLGPHGLAPRTRLHSPVRCQPVDERQPGTHRPHARRHRRRSPRRTPAGTAACGRETAAARTAGGRDGARWTPTPRPRARAQPRRHRHPRERQPPRPAPRPPMVRHGRDDHHRLVAERRGQLARLPGIHCVGCVGEEAFCLVTYLWLVCVTFP